MNVEVLGEDFMGAGTVQDTLSQAAKQVTTAFISSKLTPTQKAKLAKLQQEYGINPLPAYQGSDVQLPQEGFDFQKNLPYIIVGGVLVIGALVMLSTKRVRSNPARRRMTGWHTIHGKKLFFGYAKGRLGWHRPRRRSRSR